MNRRDERRLLRLMDRHGMAELSYSAPEGSADLSLEDLSPLHPEIQAAHAGIFRLGHPRAGRNAVFPRRVDAGEIIACLQIGALLIPVVASEDAIVPSPLFDEGDVVGFGDILF